MIERCLYCGKEHETDESALHGLKVKTCPEHPRSPEFTVIQGGSEMNIKETIEAIRKVDKDQGFAMLYLGDHTDFNATDLHALADAYEQLTEAGQRLVSDECYLDHAEYYTAEDQQPYRNALKAFKDALKLNDH